MFARPSRLGRDNLVSDPQVTDLPVHEKMSNRVLRIGVLTWTFNILGAMKLFRTSSNFFTPFVGSVACHIGWVQLVSWWSKLDVIIVAYETQSTKVETRKVPISIWLYDSCECMYGQLVVVSWYEWEVMNLVFHNNISWWLLLYALYCLNVYIYGKCICLYFCDIMDREKS